MTKVLHITNRLDQGGVDSLLLELLPRLCDENCHVDLLVLDKNHCTKKELLESRGVRVFVGSYGNVYNPMNICLIRKLIRQYDSVHVHLFPAQLWVALVAVGLSRRPRLLTTEHCTKNNRRSSKILQWIDQHMYRAYDAKIGVSIAASRNLAEWTGSDVRTIDNGIDLSCFTDITPIPRTELGVTATDFLVVMVARFFDQKDQATAIRAMEFVDSNIKLLLVGSGETMSNCQALVETLSLGKRILFLGQRDDIASILAACDLALLSTFYEGQPISIIEYFASGRAVLGTDVDGVREMLDNNPQLLHPIADHQLLAQHINELAHNPLLRAQLEASNKEASKYYTIEQMTTHYRSLYL